MNELSNWARDEGHSDGYSREPMMDRQKFEDIAFTVMQWTPESTDYDLYGEYVDAYRRVQIASQM